MLAISCPLESKKISPSVYNWEANIARVDIQQCGAEIDPLGYLAVFYLETQEGAEMNSKTFAIGASLLVQRERSLLNAGYQAPMTDDAILLVENRLGFTLRG